MMLLGCLLLAVLAAWLGVPRPPGRHLTGRFPAAPPQAGPAVRSGRRRGWVVGAAVVSLAVVIGAGLLLGPPAAVVAVVVVMTSWTVVGLAVQHRARIRDRRAEVAVARACTVLAAHLRVGQVPAEALALAAVDCAVLREARRALDLGGDVVSTWHRQAAQPGQSGLHELARAWQVSTETGAPMSATLEQVATSLSADQALRAVVAGELAAPRASGKVMAALPACGVGLGYLIGGDPLHWLLAAPLGWGCLVGGVALACAGVLWIEAIARRAAA